MINPFAEKHSENIQKTTDEQIEKLKIIWLTFCEKLELIHDKAQQEKR